MNKSTAALHVVWGNLEKVTNLSIHRMPLNGPLAFELSASLVRLLAVPQAEGLGQNVIIHAFRVLLKIGENSITNDHALRPIARSQ